MMKSLTKTLKPFLSAFRYKFSTELSSDSLEFKKYLTSTSEQDQSLQPNLLKAAQMLAQLELDEQTYNKQIERIQYDLNNMYESNLLIKEVCDRRIRIQNDIQEQVKENAHLDVRGQREIQNGKKYGVSKLAKQVLDVSDHLKQSLKLSRSLEKNEQDKAVTTEIKKLVDQLTKVFKQYGIQQFDPTNEKFDPNIHESMGMVLSKDESKKDTVAQTKRTGFMIKERLLRSAYVLVYN